jgi:hypothetical protein
MGRSRSRQSLNFEKRVRDQVAIVSENSRFAKQLRNARPSVPTTYDLKRDAQENDKFKRNLKKPKVMSNCSTPKSQGSQMSRRSFQSNKESKLRTSPKPEVFGYNGLRETRDFLSVAPPVHSDLRGP